MLEDSKNVGMNFPSLPGLLSHWQRLMTHRYGILKLWPICTRMRTCILIKTAKHVCTSLINVKCFKHNYPSRESLKYSVVAYVSVFTFQKNNHSFYILCNLFGKSQMLSIQRTLFLLVWIHLPVPFYFIVLYFIFPWNFAICHLSYARETRLDWLFLCAVAMT